MIHAGPKWDEKLRLNVTKTDYEFQEFKQMLLEYAALKERNGVTDLKLTGWDSSRDKNIKPLDIPNVPSLNQLHLHLQVQR